MYVSFRPHNYVRQEGAITMHAEMEKLSLVLEQLFAKDQLGTIEQNINKALKMVAMYKQLNEQAEQLRKNLRSLHESVEETIASPTKKPRTLGHDIKRYLRDHPNQQVNAMMLSKVFPDAHVPTIRSYLSKYTKSGNVVQLRRDLYQTVGSA